MTHPQKYVFRAKQPQYGVCHVVWKSTHVSARELSVFFVEDYSLVLVVVVVLVVVIVVVVVAVVVGVVSVAAVVSAATIVRLWKVKINHPHPMPAFCSIPER
jgi:hypothetical protein